MRFLTKLKMVYQRRVGVRLAGLAAATTLVGCGGPATPTTNVVAAVAAVPALDIQRLKSVEGQPARSLDRQEIDALLISAREIADVGGGEYVVKGRRLFDGWFFKATTIVFEPGAELVFSQKALANRRNFWVVANQIVVTDPGHPGVITYERTMPTLGPATSGEAPGGSTGRGDGDNGGTGSPGAAGITGVTGENAPQITLIAERVPGSGLLLDLSGGQGGVGGQGQRGGHGGNGAKGEAASQGMFGCYHGGGRGGAAAAGGSGGTGGTGGTGGNGGSFVLLSDAQTLPSLTEKFRVKVAGGLGGLPGAGGDGGVPGLGGPGGQDARPYCGGGDDGPGAASGPAGSSGQSGHPGGEGDYTVGSISAADFRRYIWPNAK